MHFYCPICFAELERLATICPVCGTDIPEWENRLTYTERLIQALQHPNPEARMGAIITLGNRREAAAALPLAHCAFAHPTDVVQNLAILKSMQQLPAGPQRRQALAMLTQHPAQIIRKIVAQMGELA
jgi:HEAT repeat protein